MSISVTWHGHSAFQLRGGTCTVLIDPFFSGNPVAASDWRSLERPDLVLVTHLHGDHAGDALAICRETGARLGAVVEVAAHFVGLGLPAGQICNGIGFNIGGTVTEKGVAVTMVDATHTSEAGVPVGFILVFPDGTTVYYAGDTGITANMAVWGELYDIDVALLPCGGIFTMDARQAARAAAMLRARTVVPMHWGTFPALAQDLSPFEKELAQAAPQCRCLIMQPGQTATLP